MQVSITPTWICQHPGKPLLWLEALSPCSFSCDASDAGDAYWRSYVGVMPAWTQGGIPEYQKMARSWFQSLSLRNALSQRPSGFKFVPACSSNFHMDTCYCRIAWFASWCIIASCHLSSETAPLPCCPTASPMQVITMGNLAVDWLKLSPTSTCHHRGILKLRNASPICSLLSGSHQSGYSVWRNLSEGKRFTMKPIKIQCKAWISKSNTQHSVCVRYTWSSHANSTHEQRSLFFVWYVWPEAEARESLRCQYVVYPSRRVMKAFLRRNAQKKRRATYWTQRICPSNFSVTLPGHWDDSAQTPALFWAPQGPWGFEILRSSLPVLTLGDAAPKSQNNHFLSYRL